MARARFEQLTDLVLVEIVASLPMPHVLRFARLGHWRMQQSFFRPWVTKRMTAVCFKITLKAYQTDSSFITAFCSEAVLKRLHGKVVLEPKRLKEPSYYEAFTSLMSRVPGKLYLQIGDYTYLMGDLSQVREFFERTNRMNDVVYVRHIYSGQTKKLIGFFPNVVLEYLHCYRNGRQEVLFRRVLLNGRHVISVLRAVTPNIVNKFVPLCREPPLPPHLVGVCENIYTGYPMLTHKRICCSRCENFEYLCCE